MNPAISLHAPDTAPAPATDAKTKQSAAAVPPLLVSREAAAEALGLSVATWDRQVASGKTPAPISLGGRRLFRWAELERWVALSCPDRRTFEAVTAPPLKTSNGRAR